MAKNGTEESEILGTDLVYSQTKNPHRSFNNPQDIQYTQDD